MAAVPSLTTTFTPASSCTIDLYKLQYPGITCAVGTSLVPCYFYHLGVDSSSSKCFPSGWSETSTQYFSPGICPQGYTEACSSTVGEETRATCCPSGYKCQTATDWPWYSTDLCTFVMETAQVFVFTTSTIGAGQVVSTVTDAEGLNAFGVQIRYHSTDFPSSTSSLESSSSTSSKATGTKSGASSGETGTSGSDNNGTSTSSGLSSGAKAGIGIGIAVAALAAIGLAVWLIMRHRRKAAAAGGLSAMGNAPPGAGGPGGAAGENGYLGVGSSIGSPGSSGVAYTAVSTSPNPEHQQKYYYAAGVSTPMVEAPGQQSWTPPIELPTENQYDQHNPQQHQSNNQPEYR